MSRTGPDTPHRRPRTGRGFTRAKLSLGFDETAKVLTEFAGYGVQVDVRAGEANTLPISISGIGVQVELHDGFAGMPGEFEPQRAIFLRLDGSGAGVAIFERAFKKAVTGSLQHPDRVTVHSQGHTTTLTRWVLLGS